MIGSVRLAADPPYAVGFGGVSALHVAAFPIDRERGSLPIAATAVNDERTFSLALPPGRWRISLLEFPDLVGQEVMLTESPDVTVDLDVDFRQLTGFAGLVYDAGVITDRFGPPCSLTTSVSTV